MAWRLHRLAIGACLVNFREIDPTAFREFCNTIPPKADMTERAWTPPRWLFVFNSNFASMDEDHRSASSSRQRIDHPPPQALSERLAGKTYVPSCLGTSSVTQAQARMWARIEHNLGSPRSSPLVPQPRRFVRATVRQLSAMCGRLRSQVTAPEMVALSLSTRPTRRPFRADRVRVISI